MRADGLLVNSVLILFGANQRQNMPRFVVVLCFISSLVLTSYASVCSQNLFLAIHPFHFAHSQRLKFKCNYFSRS